MSKRNGASFTALIACAVIVVIVAVVLVIGSEQNARTVQLEKDRDLLQERVINLERSMNKAAKLAQDNLGWTNKDLLDWETVEVPDREEDDSE